MSGLYLPQNGLFVFLFLAESRADVGDLEVEESFLPDLFVVILPRVVMYVRTICRTATDLDLISEDGDNGSR